MPRPKRARESSTAGATEAESSSNESVTKEDLQKFKQAFREWLRPPGATYPNPSWITLAEAESDARPNKK
jgi:hypothetical protein